MKAKRLTTIILLHLVNSDDLYIHENKNMEIIYVLLIDTISKAQYLCKNMRKTI